MRKRKNPQGGPAGSAADDLAIAGASVAFVVLVFVDADGNVEIDSGAQGGRLPPGTERLVAPLRALVDGLHADFERRSVEFGETTGRYRVDIDPDKPKGKS